MRKVNGIYVDDPTASVNLSDQVVVQYSDHIKSILRSKFTGSRFARYTSSTAQIGFSAVAASASAFSLGTTTLARLALASTLMPQVGGIFNAKARAETYQQAIELIEEAEIDYLAEAGNPSDRKLTTSGVKLYRRVVTTIHLVEKALVGQIPSLKEMEAVSDAPIVKRESPRFISASPGRNLPIETRRLVRVEDVDPLVSVTSQEFIEQPVRISGGTSGASSSVGENRSPKRDPLQGKKKTLINRIARLSAEELPDSTVSTIRDRFRGNQDLGRRSPRGQLQTLIERTTSDSTLTNIEAAVNSSTAVSRSSESNLQDALHDDRKRVIDQIHNIDRANISDPQIQLLVTKLKGDIVPKGNTPREQLQSVVMQTKDRTRLEEIGKEIAALSTPNTAGLEQLRDPLNEKKKELIDTVHNLDRTRLPDTRATELANKFRGNLELKGNTPREHLQSVIRRMTNSARLEEIGKEITAFPAPITPGVAQLQDPLNEKKKELIDTVHNLDRTRLPDARATELANKFRGNLELKGNTPREHLQSIIRRTTNSATLDAIKAALPTP